MHMCGALKLMYSSFLEPSSTILYGGFSSNPELADMAHFIRQLTPGLLFSLSEAGIAGEPHTDLAPM